MTKEYISTTPIAERSPRVQHKIYHHLDCLKRGKMTLWLKNRMAWDAEVCAAVAEVLMPAPRRNQTEEFYELLRQRFYPRVKEQFEKQSAFYDLFVGKQT